MENIIKKLIKETLGVFLPIENLSNILSKEFFDYINNLKNTNQNSLFKSENFAISLVIPEELKNEKLPIEGIVIMFNFDSLKEKNKVGGNFLSSKTRQLP